MNKAAIRALRENYDVMDDDLKAQVDADCERFANAGRKPFAPSKLRSRKIQVSLNAGEFTRIIEALGAGTELASGIRQLALQAADQINASR